jgi:hypothetical protein
MLVYQRVPSSFKPYDCWSAETSKMFINIQEYWPTQNPDVLDDFLGTFRTYHNKNSLYIVLGSLCSMVSSITQSPSPCLLWTRLKSQEAQYCHIFIMRKNCEKLANSDPDLYSAAESINFPVN